MSVEFPFFVGGASRTIRLSMIDRIEWRIVVFTTFLGIWKRILSGPFAERRSLSEDPQR